MKTWDLIRAANRNLFRNKLRTFLTVAAIFVGSFTLTMTNGLGDGLRAYIESQVKNVESDRVILVRRKIEVPEEEKGNFAAQEYKDGDDGGVNFDPTSIIVTLPQMEEAVKGLPGVKSVTPRYSVAGEYITLDGQKKYKVVLGMYSEGVVAKPEAGTFINGTGQLILPFDLAKELDQNVANLVGKTATVAFKANDKEIKTIPLQVVGVATKGMMTNIATFVDATTAKQIYAMQVPEGEGEKFGGFSVQMETADAAKIAAVKKALAEKGFEGDTFADTQERIYDAVGIFKIGMGLVAAIALLAASFGIINTLVIAVLERTKEIGLQKALGMGRGKIFAIFSLESVLIGFWGALLGTLGGIVVGLIANTAISAYSKSFEGFSLFVFTLPSILTVMLIVSAIAFFAGVLPAIRASRLNPIESLRYE